MKIVAAILLLGILLFNWVGYRILSSYMQDKADRQLVSRLDQQEYDESQLISIKAPITNLAYYNNSAAFERVDGEIDINGIPYQYVERRIYHDSLEVLCIPNQTALQLRRSRDDYFNTVNDIGRGTQEQRQGSFPGSSKTFSIDDLYTLTDPLQIGDRSFRVVTVCFHFFVRIPSIPHATDERPPEAIV